MGEPDWPFSSAYRWAEGWPRPSGWDGRKTGLTGLEAFIFGLKGGQSRDFLPPGQDSTVIPALL